MDLNADILLNPAFEPEELARERAVVLQEIGQAHDTPDDIIFDHFQETAYPGQALGRPVLGRPEIVSLLCRDSLVSYMTRHYGVGQTVLAAAGQVDHEDFVALIESAFEKLPSADGATAEPARYEGGDYREARKLEQVHLLFGFDAVSYLDPDYYGLMVLSTLFGGGMSSRLFQEVRERRGLVYAIYSFVSAYRDGGLLGIYAGTGEAEAAELIPVVCDELAKLTGMIEDSEIERAKTQLKASILMSRESGAARCEQLAQQLLTFGRSIPPAEMLEKITAVDGAALNRLAAGLMRATPSVAALGPVAGVEPFDRLVGRLG